MAAATQQSTTTTKQEERPRPSDQVAAIPPVRLPYHPLMQEFYGIDKVSWRALVDAVFPHATSTASIALALSYCKARKLDVFKKNVHIVPIWNKDLKRYIDTIWPGIGELRTTAFRTREYAGRGETEFGPDISRKIGTLEVTFPEWARITVFRIVQGQRVEFVGAKVYWIETYASKKYDDDTPNEMWATRPRGQLEKCAEAAALRGAFPEEVGCDYIPEEVQRSPVMGINQEKLSAASNDLSGLTERLEQEQGDSSENQEPTLAKDRESGMTVEGAWETFVSELSKTEQVLDARNVYDHWFGPDAEFEFTPDQNAEATRLRDAHVAGIESTRGTRSNKQKTLNGTQS